MKADKVMMKQRQSLIRNRKVTAPCFKSKPKNPLFNPGDHSSRGGLRSSRTRGPTLGTGLRGLPKTQPDRRLSGGQGHNPEVVLHQRPGQQHRQQQGGHQPVRQIDVHRSSKLRKR